VKDPQWKKGFALLAKYNLSFDLHLWPTQVNKHSLNVHNFPQVQDAIEVLKENPNIQVIVDHTGLPFGYLDPSEKALNLWKSELKKVCCLMIETTHFSTACRVAKCRIENIRNCNDTSHCDY
jgi:predicted TIM-barrel fold metal-dependent hydrolase